MRGGGRFWGRRALVAGQVALSLVLLAAAHDLVHLATSLLHGFDRILMADPGFRKDGLLMASFDPTVHRVPPGTIKVFYPDLLERARSLPGVQSAALANAIPLSTRQFQVTFLPEGLVLRKGNRAPAPGATSWIQRTSRPWACPS